MKPRILLAGLGETGTELANKLKFNWDVIGVDPENDALEGFLVEQEANPSMRLFQGDATSALVLRKAGLEGVHAAVACTGSDEINLEVLRLARELFGIPNLYTLMYQLDWEDRYAEHEIDIISQDHACAAIIESRIARGQKVAADVGLGIGEIMEVKVLANSSVIGRPLAQLQPSRWVVGAIYRNNRLVVPHGDTKLLQGDRVLIVGDPDILPSIATLIRTGESEFPLQYGSNLVCLYDPDIEGVLDEARYLIDRTRAERLEAIACNIDEGNLEALGRRCESEGIPYEFSCHAQSAKASLLQEASRSDVGVLLMPPEKLGFLAKVGLGRTRTATTMDLVHSPVLISRKSFPYARVLLVMAQLPFPGRAAQLAIDIVRILDAEMHLAVVHQPEIVVGNGLKDDIEKRRRDVENLASMYHVKVQAHVLEGNPIHEILGAAVDYDLIIIPYRKGQRPFLTRPDIAINIIHRAPCSVMVMPV